MADHPWGSSDDPLEILRYLAQLQRERLPPPDPEWIADVLRRADERSSDCDRPEP